MGQCLAISLELKNWRCRNDAGTHWLCHQHRRWPFKLLAGVIIAPMIAGYIWGLIAPPTKVERESTTQLNHIEQKENDYANETDTKLAHIEKLLENKDSQPKELQKFVDEGRFETRFPLGYALFYYDGRKTLHYGRQISFNFNFDPASVKVISLEENTLCIDAKILVMNLTNSCFNISGPGTITLLNIGNAAADVESLAGSAGGAAWVIGIRPVVNSTSLDQAH